LPDLNVWLALSWANHMHSDAAWTWFSRQEAVELDVAFRAATRPASRLSSPKALGDCYLRAVSQVTDATLVTFDRGLASECQKFRQRVALLEPGAWAKPKGKPVTERQSSQIWCTLVYKPPLKLAS